jgi:alpha/beta hydrolase fold
VTAADRRRAAWLAGMAGLAGLLLVACTGSPDSPPDPAGTPPTSISATPASDVQLVDVGGHQLWLECQGSGSPTVILEGGLGVYSGTWFAVMPMVAEVTRVCRFDRAGLGQSERGPMPRTSKQMVAELHTLLSKGGVEGPYVLVGHSFAGLNIHLYASTYPKDVAGLVFVDAVHPDLDGRIEKLLSAKQAAERRAELELNQEGIRFRDILASEEQVRAAKSLPDVPLVVIRHGVPFDGGPGWPTEGVEKLWTDLQSDLARLTPQGDVVVATMSGHRIQEDQPEVVGDAIEQVITSARR